MSFIGEIKLFAGSFAPRGWKHCNGETLEMYDYPALYAVLGPEYGGDGVTNFALPNIAPLPDSDGRGESIYIVCVDGEFPRRS